MPEARFSTAESARSNEEGIRLTGFANPGQDEHGYLPLSPDVVEASGMRSFFNMKIAPQLVYLFTQL
jgi:hypothetical protein